MAKEKVPESVRYEKLLHRITNTTQLKKFINSVSTAESQIKHNLDKYIETRNHVAESRKLELARTELLTSLNNSSNLVSLLGNAGALASAITARVRVLDIERERVKETLNYVTDVKSLRGLILATHQAIEVRDYASAAKNLDEIRKLRLNGAFISNVVPSTDVPEEPEVVINKWIGELTDIFIKEFNKASESRDVENLTFFFQLFPLLGQASIGLDCYSKFICAIISSQSRIIITNQSQQDKMGFFPAALTRLLEIISKMINQHSIIIAKYYGIHYMTDIVEKVEKETDSQAGLIADTFYDYRGIERTLTEIENYKFKPITNQIIATNKGSDSNNSSQPTSNRPSFESQGRPSEDSGIAINQINDLILELSNFCKYWSMYCKFVAVKWNEYLQVEVNDIDGLKLPPPITDSKFTLKLQNKITPAFEKLMEFFLKKSLNQTFQLEELPKLNPYLLNKSNTALAPESVPSSSISEDLTLILSSTFKLTIETGHPLTLTKIVNTAKKSIESDYLLIIYRRLKELYPRANTNLTAIHIQPQTNNPNSSNLNKQSTMNSFFQRGASALNQLTQTDDEERLHYFVIYLNSLGTSLDYISKIVAYNKELVKSNFQFGQDSEKLISILGNFENMITESFQKILKENLNILFNQCFKNKLNNLVNDFFKATDGGENKQYLISSFSDDNVPLQQFTKQWNSLINPYIRVLDSKNYDTLLTLIITSISGMLERKIWALDQNINELGSIKLEREVSSIISELTRGKYHLREKFVKITQIIMIIGLNKDNDELELNWVLTPNERTKARTLRVD